MIEGRTTLVLADAELLESVFAATLAKEGSPGLITHCRERDVLPVTSPQEALRDLEWLIGTREDQSEDVHVVTTVRWASASTASAAPKTTSWDGRRRPSYKPNRVRAGDLGTELLYLPSYSPKVIERLAKFAKRKTLNAKTRENSERAWTRPGRI